MPGPEDIIVPSLTPETARFFVAEAEAEKRNAVIESLREAGLGARIEVTADYHFTRRFMLGQAPGNVQADVLLIDPVVDRRAAGGNRQGNRLVGSLLQTYRQSYGRAFTEASKALTAHGLTGQEARAAINSDETAQMADHRLQSEFLIVGISDDPDASIDYPAQVPRVSYEEVGQVVRRMIMSESTPQSPPEA